MGVEMAGVWIQVELENAAQLLEQMTAERGETLRVEFPSTQRQTQTISLGYKAFREQLL